MPTSVTIGGTAYTVPVMNFAALKAAWDDIKSLSSVADPVRQAAIAIRILSAALASSQPTLTATAIENALTVAEFPALIIAVIGVLQDAGLVAVGEPPLIPPVPPSTTSTI